MVNILSSGVLWTPGIGLQSHVSGLTPLCRLTGKQGARILPSVTRADIGWAWTAPRKSDRAIVEKLTGRFVADMEAPAPSTPAAELGAYWRGLAGEVAHAEHIAAHAIGVTSHGFVKHPMRETLAVMARTGLPAFPQVYDNDGSTARKRGGSARFLRDCVRMHTDLGFTRVIPILGLKAGPDIVRAWLDVCAADGLTWHLWRLGNWSPSFAFVREYLAPAVAPAPALEPLPPVPPVPDAEPPIPPRVTAR